MGVVPTLDMETSYVVVTATRALQLVFTGVVTGLTAAILKKTYQYGGVPSSVRSAQNFLMFCAVINWLSAVYGLVGRYIQSIAIPILQMPLDGAGAIFSLIGAIVVSAKLGVVDCHKAATDEDNPYDLDDGWLAAWPARGTDDSKGDVEKKIEERCRMFQADDVFMYILFVTVALCLFFTFRAWKGGRGLGGFGRKSGSNAGGIV